MCARVCACVFTWWCGRTPQQCALSCTTPQETCARTSPRSRPAVVWSMRSADQSCPARQPEHEDRLLLVSLFSWTGIWLCKGERVNSHSRLDSPEIKPGTLTGAAWWTFWWPPVWCGGPARWPPGRHLWAHYWGPQVSGWIVKWKLDIKLFFFYRGETRTSQLYDKITLDPWEGKASSKSARIWVPSSLCAAFTLDKTRSNHIQSFAVVYKWTFGKCVVFFLTEHMFSGGHSGSRGCQPCAQLSSLSVEPSWQLFYQIDSKMWAAAISIIYWPSAELRQLQTVQTVREASNDEKKGLLKNDQWFLLRG